MQMMVEQRSFEERLSDAGLLGDCRRSDQNVFMQAKVLNQFSLERNSAKCGYHALFNGNLLAAASRNESNELLQQLNAAASLSDTLSRWCILVTQLRLRSKIRNYLAPLVMSYYKGVSGLNSRQREAFTGITAIAWSDAVVEPMIKEKISSVIESLSGCQELLHEKGADSYSCALTRRSMYGPYNSAMTMNAESNSGVSRLIDQFLAQEEIFNSLFKEFDIVQEFSASKRGSAKYFSVDNEWLTSEEIESLIRYENDHSKSGNQIRYLFFSSVLTEEAELQPFADLRKSLSQGEDVSAVVLICTIDQGLFSGFFNSDHWFTLVVNTSHGQDKYLSEYIVADSTSQYRLVDPRVQVIADYLEGKRNTLDLPKQEVPVLAIVGVVSGVVCFIVYKVKNAQKRKPVQRQRVKNVHELMQQNHPMNLSAR